MIKTKIIAFCNKWPKIQACIYLIVIVLMMLIWLAKLYIIILL